MIKKGVLGLGLLVALIVTCCSNSNENPQPTNNKKKLTLLTYNIHHGAPANSDAINLNNIAAVINSQLKNYFLFLVAVFVGNNGTGITDMKF